MTDGPFKNSALAKRWKRYADALLNDATTPQERTAMASHGVLHDVLSRDTRELFGDLKRYAGRAQLELDPMAGASEIFDRHPRSPFADTLQRHLNQNLFDKVAPDPALDRALSAASDEAVKAAGNRMMEECLHVRDTKDMSGKQFRVATERNADAFGRVDVDAVCRAIEAGDRNAFKPAIAKKDGVDEGPDE